MTTHGMIQLTSGQLRILLIVCFCWSLVIIVADSQRTDPIEVNALQSIRRSLNAQSRTLPRWNRGDPCTSNWSGIICSNETVQDGYLHVTELSLLNRSLSGSLSPELGRLSHLRILDFMWNNITGSIPREIGNITTLRLLLLNGNQLTGSLPDELGNLVNLNRIQIDQNQISGPIPLSFANLREARHFHMNNNSLTGQIPPELSRLPNLFHLLLDNNNLSGYLPSELSEIRSLRIVQLDNNNFGGNTIPSSYGNMSQLLKLSLRNCSLRGPIPDWSNMTSIAYIDLSLNQLNGSIPAGALGENITTIDLSHNNLNGTIPASFTSLPRFQRLSFANNKLSGSISSSIWLNRNLNSTERLILEFGNNNFSSIAGNFLVPPNITIGLEGNPLLCSNNNLVGYCGSHAVEFDNPVNVTILNDCPQSCPPSYENSPVAYPVIGCFCAAPLYIGYRLKSPGFSDFVPYFDRFMQYLSSGLGLDVSQLEIDSCEWETGHRLGMSLKIFPAYVNNNSGSLFNNSEVFRIREMFGGWSIRDNPVFGPYELLDYTSELYSDDTDPDASSGISTGALIGIVVGSITGAVGITVLLAFLIFRRYIRKHYPSSSSSQLISRALIKTDGMKVFTYAEMALATNKFSSSSVVGKGGYGKVYRGVLTDGTVVAIKRAQEGSLQGEKEFLTEIELLSRLHHKNLVSLLGYCDEQREQMLIYEFMSNGTLRDHLSGGKSKMALSFAMRIRIALGSSRGIMYLHTEANPPIFHRDIKASNILLDSKLTPKVADFGLSKLAPAPELEGDLPCHVSTVVKGTPGYLDPEYFLTHKLTDKSDVYSLGVVFLELLTGLRPIQNGKNIVREVNNAYRSGTIFSIVDETMGSYLSECVEKFINLALKCCLDDTDARPSMVQVVRELENIWLMIPESDTKMSDTIVNDKSGKFMTPPTSSTSSRNPYLSQDQYPYASQDISGSELVSGMAPTVEPR